MMIGKKLSPILCEIEDTLWQSEIANTEKPNFSQDAFRASIKIFMSNMLDKMWEIQEKDNIDMIDREKMATKLGESISEIIKIYTNIDTKDFYK